MNASIIAGATKPEQLEQNVKAVEWTLTAEDFAEVDRITKPSVIEVGPSLPFANCRTLSGKSGRVLARLAFSKFHGKQAK